MALVRCPACGRVASGSTCFACGQSLEAVVASPAAGQNGFATSAPPSQANDEVFDADDLGVVTEAPRPPPPIETWAVRAPGQSLDVLSGPPRPAPVAWEAPAPGPVVEGIVLSDVPDDDLAVVQGAPLSLEPAGFMGSALIASGDMSPRSEKSHLDPFSPFARSRAPAVTPPDDDLLLMADLASQSGVGLVDMALQGAQPETPSGGDVSAIEMTDGFDIVDDFDVNDGYAAPAPPSDASFGHASMDVSFDDAFEVNAQDLGGEVPMPSGAAALGDPYANLDVDAGDLSAGDDVRDDAALAAAFFSNDDLDLPPTDVHVDREAAAGSSEPEHGDATSRFARPSLVAPEDSDETALFRLPTPSTTPSIGDAAGDAFGDAYSDALADALEPESTSSMAALDDVDDESDPFGLMDGMSFPDSEEAIPSGASGFDQGVTEGAAEEAPPSVPPLSFDLGEDVPAPPSLDAFDAAEVDDSETTLPLVARPQLPSSWEMPSDPGPESLSTFSQNANGATGPRSALTVADEGVDAFAVEVAPLSADAPGTTRAVLDEDGALVPHSAHANATRLHTPPVSDDADAVSPIAIDRAYARDMSARIGALAEEMEGAGRFEAAALLYEVQTALDGT